MKRLIGFAALCVCVYGAWDVHPHFVMPDKSSPAVEVVPGADAERLRAIMSKEEGPMAEVYDLSCLPCCGPKGCIFVDTFTHGADGESIDGELPDRQPVWVVWECDAQTQHDLDAVWEVESGDPRYEEIGAQTYVGGLDDGENKALVDTGFSRGLIEAEIFGGEVGDYVSIFAPGGIEARYETTHLSFGFPVMRLKVYSGGSIVYTSPSTNFSLGGVVYILVTDERVAIFDTKANPPAYCDLPVPAGGDNKWGFSVPQSSVAGSTRFGYVSRVTVRCLAGFPEDCQDEVFKFCNPVIDP